MNHLTILNGDALAMLRTLEPEIVNCVVTSPPYWGLRDYGVAGQIGLEESLGEYLERLMRVFAEVWRVLRNDGTCWVNMGDSYAANRTYQVPSKKGGPKHGVAQGIGGAGASVPDGLKPKDIIGQPWRLAFALQAAGWVLRQDIIWNKPNPMPESVTDRCTKAHEYLFLLTKQARYFWDEKAMEEPCSPATHARMAQDVANQNGSARAYGGTKRMKTVVKGSPKVEQPVRVPSGWDTGPGAHAGLVGNYRVKNNESFDRAMAIMPTTRNRRSVWTIPTQGFKGAHFATFPEALVRPCILAGCPVGGTVLDPFGGSGTVGKVALECGRKAILIELNPKYAALAVERCKVTMGLGL